jgi:drug/metabolite transporter (DMT)-like permease
MMRIGDAGRLILLSAIWGSSFLLIEIGLEDLSPWQIVAGRLLFGSAVLLALLRLRGERMPSDTVTWRGLAVMAIVSNIVPFSLITWGQESITSSLAAILNSTTPLFTAGIAAAVVPGERLTVLRSTGIVIGFAGVGVIVGVDVNGSGGDLAGELAVVLASLSYAVGFVFAKRRLTGRGASPLALPAGQLALGAGIALVPAGIATGASADVPGAPATLSIVALGAIGTGIAYVLYYRLVHDVGPTTASFVTYLIPVFGVALGWTFLDETIGLNTLLGAILVIGGITIAERGAREPAHHDFEPSPGPGPTPSMDRGEP